jgi:hypothetical protein
VMSIASLRARSLRFIVNERDMILRILVVRVVINGT